MKKRMIEQILTLLIKEYGNPELQPYQSPTTVLIQTILSQNTSDINSHQALASLMATFSGWKDIADASTEEIAYAIRAGGLGEIKARYIKQSLLEIGRQRGDYELDFLSQFSLDKARDVYGVVLDTSAELLDVDYGATRKRREDLSKQKN